ncbi:Predicted lipoprotein with conserved Yx(FWY)xxD motif [Saccharopolyspora antimicrobica]|uniref:Lipoprotein with Yx(FWY)xxD motif n=1 Tax=Saccharopolyspora antimicrobica TaxID=455193 RepID=A0A1I5LTM3_9PSEU|nr:hypothetical protein [Saccharopolyspora antimicrobica]RKT87339.1 putative lipoprotein with Yx(FWY)xxD motif [Saccharopolyspora antimicrobica]SFP00582.1 Predicted lipoprotein with conserved Yx(FWY)xxD motif [Saccharopolyspora antimicrobica]
MPLRRIAVIATTACTLAIAACSSGEQTESASQTPSATTEAPTVVSIRSAPTGDYLVDASGRTLYLYTKDEPGISKCAGQCATQWPPLTGTPQAGPGVDPAQLGTANRPDGGGQQITFAGQPLYYFAQDMAAGDTKGQNKMQVWYLVDPRGEAIKTAAPGG